MGRQPSGHITPACPSAGRRVLAARRSDPPDVSSGPAFQQWMCRTHNTVNRSIGKPVFNCDLVGARWAPLDCDAANSCDMGLRRPR